MSLQRTIGVVGIGAASLLGYHTPRFEGEILRGYKDPIGIVTACSGHTKTAVLGRPYTKRECEKLLDEDLAEHAVGVLECTPNLKGHAFQLAAAVSLAYSIGVTKYCRSSVPGKFERGEFDAACRTILEFRLPLVDGEPLPGILKRRQIEHDLCREGLM